MEKGGGGGGVGSVDVTILDVNACKCYALFLESDWLVALLFLLK